MTGRIPSLDALKGRLQWLQARQSVLAGNVAHADTPGFRPRDLVSQEAGGGALSPVATHFGHVGAAAAGRPPGAGRVAAFETRPSGNAVSLEDEMLKLAETQIEHQLAAGLYQRSIAYLRTAIGRRG